MYDLLPRLVDRQRREAASSSPFWKRGPIRGDLHTIGQIGLQQMAEGEIDCRYNLRACLLRLRNTIGDSRTRLRDAGSHGWLGRGERGEGETALQRAEKRLRVTPAVQWLCAVYDASNGRSSSSASSTIRVSNYLAQTYHQIS